LKFKVYQDAKLLRKKVIGVTKNFPRDFCYLKDQIRRSSLSIVLNIAEGSAKRSDRDFNRYLENSMGSANETAAALDIALAEKLIREKQFIESVELCRAVVDQLGGFSKKLLVGG